MYPILRLAVDHTSITRIIYSFTLTSRSIAINHISIHGDITHLGLLSFISITLRIYTHYQSYLDRSHYSFRLTIVHISIILLIYYTHYQSYIDHITHLHSRISIIYRSHYSFTLTINHISITLLI